MNSPLPLIYIAGPFRGPTPLDVRRNVERARDWGMTVAHAGGYPVIPHTMTADFDKQLTDEFWLAGTLEMLRRCDAIFMIPGWDLSSGARAELRDAELRRLPTFFHDGGTKPLRDWIAAWRSNRVPIVPAEPV